MEVDPTTLVAAYAAAVATVSLIWQIVSKLRERRPDVTLTGRFEAAREGDAEGRPDEPAAVTLVVRPTENVVMAQAGLNRSRWRRWTRRPEPMGRARALVKGDDLRLPVPGLPTVVPATSWGRVWLPLEASGHGRDGLRGWIRTSSGHLYWTQPIQSGGDDL